MRLERFSPPVSFILEPAKTPEHFPTKWARFVSENATNMRVLTANDSGAFHGRRRRHRVPRSGAAGDPQGGYSVHVDTDLWNKPAELEAPHDQCRGIIVRNRTQVTAGSGRQGAQARSRRPPRRRPRQHRSAACTARNITVCPAIGANAVSVAEYVIGSALMLARRAAYFGAQHSSPASGRARQPAAAGKSPARRLGIIGYGNIGQTVAGRARAMGMTRRRLRRLRAGREPGLERHPAAFARRTAAHLRRRLAALPADARNAQYARRRASRSDEERARC